MKRFTLFIALVIGLSALSMSSYAQKEATTNTEPYQVSEGTEKCDHERRRQGEEKDSIKTK